MTDFSRADVLRSISEMRKMAELADVMEETGDPEVALAIRLAIHDRLQETAKVIDAASGGDGMTKVAWNPFSGWTRKVGTELPVVAEQLGLAELGGLKGEARRGAIDELARVGGGYDKVFDPKTIRTRPTLKGYIGAPLTLGGIGALTLRGGKGPGQMPGGTGGIPMPGGGNVNPGELPTGPTQSPTGPADIPYPGTPPPDVMPSQNGMAPAPVGMPDPQAGMETQQVQQMGMMMQQMMGKMQELDTRLRNAGV